MYLLCEGLKINKNENENLNVFQTEINLKSIGIVNPEELLYEIYL